MSLTMILGQNHFNFFIRNFIITRVERTDKKKTKLRYLMDSSQFGFKDLRYLHVADKWINFVIWRRFMIKSRPFE